MIYAVAGHAPARRPARGRNVARQRAERAPCGGPLAPAPPRRRRTGGPSATRAPPLGRLCLPGADGHACWRAAVTRAPPPNRLCLPATRRARRCHCTLSASSRRHAPDGLPARLGCTAARDGRTRLERTPRRGAPGGILRRGPRGTGGTPRLQRQIAVGRRPYPQNGPLLKGPPAPRSGVARFMGLAGTRWRLPACLERGREGQAPHVRARVAGAGGGGADLAAALPCTAVHQERSAGSKAAPAAVGGGAGA